MSRTLIALLAAWLALSIGGKVARYAPEQEAAGPRADRLVREFLGAYGWSLAERQKMTRAGLYTAQIFNKAGCDQRMAVAALGAADEAADVAVDQLGQDVAFLEDGQFSARPSAGAFFASAARAGLTLELASPSAHPRHCPSSAKDRNGALRAAGGRRLGKSWTRELRVRHGRLPTAAAGAPRSASIAATRHRGGPAVLVMLEAAPRWRRRRRAFDEWRAPGARLTAFGDPGSRSHNAHCELQLATAFAFSGFICRHFRVNSKRFPMARSMHPVLQPLWIAPMLTQIVLAFLLLIICRAFIPAEPPVYAWGRVTHGME